MAAPVPGLEQILEEPQTYDHVRHKIHGLRLSNARAITSSSRSSATEDVGTLIPKLPDSVALHCLARVPRSALPLLRCVCRSWNRALSTNTRDIASVRREIGTAEPWIYFSFSPRGDCIQSQRSSNYFTAFDPGSNQWHSVGWLPGLERLEVLKGYGCVGLGGKLYVLGGTLCIKERDFGGGCQRDLRVRSEVLAYDCIGGRWKQCASMRKARVDFACSVSGGRVFVAGGRGRLDHENAAAMASAEVYIPELDRWEELPDMSITRYKCVGVTLKGKFFVIGGYTIETLHRSSVEIYDPSERRWERRPGMWALDIPPYEVVELQGKLYRSGDQLNHWRGSIDVYDERLKMWKTIRGSNRRIGEDLQCTVRRYVTMAGIDSYLLFFGGHCRVGDRSGDHRPFCLETVDAFQAPIGRWCGLDPFRSSCRELCSSCCVVTA
ncbi:hypothetical protein SELMODRAFT_405137 [Selaginella moellendorffii]|uniref:F-box domain-containing protein n=1 Tax=Selaginella moellendorffii TaxID=88036 RepID=D8QYI8_SELML|nr:F-box/kelch-repeat protein At1g16250 [Selaginella moellendorffii]EFJ35207.1 hypothetical protein SELMODRAFT_405137 [Selaginella moellendorffii]|eukprot:XP_002963336.1 F-box/kelch-repeat protein At1g16250 [Selaginella moellendorffii]